jgi:hypothetical protein
MSDLQNRLTSVLGREINLNHEKVSDLVFELVDKAEEQNRLKEGDQILITKEDGSTVEAIYQSSQWNGALVHFKLKHEFMFGMIGVGNVAKVVEVKYGK